MTEVLFFIAAIGALAGAIGVIALDNPFYAVLALVTHLLSLATLFLLLDAQFVAAAQVVVYAGAVMVLYVFVVSYVGGQGPTLMSPGPGLRIVAALFAAALFVEFCIAILGTGLQAFGERAKVDEDVFGLPEQIGNLLLTKFLLPFEVASLLLLVAAVGAVVLARRRRGLEPAEDSRTLTASDLIHGGRVGTLAEVVGTRPMLPERARVKEPGEGGW